jgi:hypothetical protein
MKKNTLGKLFWIFWYSTTMLTGILAGFLLSHAIMLGRFFQWFMDSGNENLLHQTYTVFRAASSPHIAYNIPLSLAFVSGIIWTVFAFIARRDRIMRKIGGQVYFLCICFLGLRAGDNRSCLLPFSDIK